MLRNKARRVANIAAKRYSRSVLPSVSIYSRQASSKASNMACYHCEQTTEGVGCFSLSQGVCGKLPSTADIQDRLIYVMFAACDEVFKSGTYSDTEMIAKGRSILKTTFMTLTNVNFDDEALFNATEKHVTSQMNVKPVGADEYRLLQRKANYGCDDLFSLHNIIEYGIKGHAAYVTHAEEMRQYVEDHGTEAQNNEMKEQNDLAQIYRDFFKLGSFMFENFWKPQTDMNGFVEMAMFCGHCGVGGMKYLSDMHRTSFGVPVPSPVGTTAKQGKCILVSGHDMVHLKDLLEATKGTGINIYTHGEMLPGHGYPELKKYDNLVGHFGTAWQNQLREFKNFPGPVVMTSNCIREPTSKYKDRIFTCGPVGWPGIPHINGNKCSVCDGSGKGRFFGSCRKCKGSGSGGLLHDFSDVIECAKNTKGFEGGETIYNSPETSAVTGFGHEAILANAPEILKAVENGDLKDFYVIGGCDGTENGDLKDFYVIGGCDGTENSRKYFGDIAASSTKDSLILTLGCGKFRFSHMEHGNIQNTNIPRFLDCGQCNDAYSAVVVAQTLAQVLNCDINDLPLHNVVSWLEQKAVIVLLVMLKLNFKNIYLGPALPAFITPGVLGFLVEKFNIQGTNTADFQSDFNKMKVYSADHQGVLQAISK